MAEMENNEVVELLREIRDLQKLHVENYNNALKNQQDAIVLQQKAARFQRISLLILIIVFVVFLAWVIVPR